MRHNPGYLLQLGRQIAALRAGARGELNVTYENNAARLADGAAVVAIAAAILAAAAVSSPGVAALPWPPRCQPPPYQLPCWPGYICELLESHHDPPD